MISKRTEQYQNDGLHKHSGRESVKRKAARRQVFAHQLDHALLFLTVRCTIVGTDPHTSGMLDTGFGPVGEKVPILTSKLFEKHGEEGAYSLSVWANRNG